jgi:hypothetical protein
MANARTKAALVGGGIAVAVILMRSKKARPSEDSIEELPDEEKETKETLEEILLRLESPDGKARLGGMYLIKQGDLPLAVMREALFGNRNPVSDPVKRRAAIDLLERTECSPWNQANYARGPDALQPNHATLVKQRYVQKGISFNPIYSNNRARMMLGDQPTSAPGKYFAYIWIPNIDIDRFDQTGEITLEGMNWPDNFRGTGHSMIDPPIEIVDIGFDEITNSAVGCQFPEGDFRRFVVAT